MPLIRVDSMITSCDAPLRCDRTLIGQVTII